MIKRIAVIGAGGCAREIAWLIDEISASPGSLVQYSLSGFIVSDYACAGLYDSPIVGDLSWLEHNQVDALAIGIGTPSLRLKIVNEVKHRFPCIEWPALIHPSVRFQRASVWFGEGVIVCAGCAVTLNVRVQPFSLIGLSCTISHEASIGRGCALNPGVNISGGVQVGDGVLVGTGAQVLQYLTIGDGARIGAGAVVTRDVPPGATVAGVPAKNLRPFIPRRPCSPSFTQSSTESDGRHVDRC